MRPQMIRGLCPKPVPRIVESNTCFAQRRFCILDGVLNFRNPIAEVPRRHDVPCLPARLSGSRSVPRKASGEIGSKLARWPRIMHEHPSRGDAEDVLAVDLDVVDVERGF